MGYSDFDRALLDAWYRAREQCKDDPGKLAEILRRRGMATYARPLRSWSLVLRACDSRIDDYTALGRVRIDRARIRAFCSPVTIREPGVSLAEAARLFGVNRTTVSRWADPAPEERSDRKKRVTWYQDVQRQIAELRDLKWPPSTYRVTGRRLMLSYFLNRADRKRSTARVWTPSFYGLDPGGEVDCADWGSLRSDLADKVDSSFLQQLQRVDRKLGPAEGALAFGSSRALGNLNPGAEALYAEKRRSSARVWQWVCPEVDGGCGRLVYKLYLPMPYWTLVGLFGEEARHKRSDRIGLIQGGAPGSKGPSPGFLCLKCAGLVYESTERGSTPGFRKDGSRRRVDVLDRAVKRMSGGVLRRADVFTDS